MPENNILKTLINPYKVMNERIQKNPIFKVEISSIGQKNTFCCTFLFFKRFKPNGLLCTINKVSRSQLKVWLRIFVLKANGSETEQIKADKH